MGKHQLRLLQFALKYPGWHGYAKDRTTTQAVNGLARLGLIKINEFRQFRLNNPDGTIFAYNPEPELCPACAATKACANCISTVEQD